MKFMLVSLFMMLSLILKYTLSKNNTKLSIFEYLSALLFFIVGLLLWEV
jgi:hypothetical protein